MFLIIYSGFFCGILIYLSLMYNVGKLTVFESVEVNISGDLPKPGNYSG